jgi:hypothetical protein
METQSAQLHRVGSIPPPCLGCQEKNYQGMSPPPHEGDHYKPGAEVLSSVRNFLLRRCHRWIPTTESIPPIIIQHFRPYLQKQMCSPLCPAHLLRLRDSLAHNTAPGLQRFWISPITRSVREQQRRAGLVAK